MVDHVFMPPRLPQNHESESRKKDANLLGFVRQAAGDFSQDISTSEDGPDVARIWKLIVKMLDVMGGIYGIQGISKDKLERALVRMTVGGLSITLPRLLPKLINV